MVTLVNLIKPNRYWLELFVHARCICTLEAPSGGVFYHISPCFSQTFEMPLNGSRSLSNFTIGTFNVRGLSSAIKRDQLSEDLNRLHIDVCCIQETKCPSGFDVISGYYRLIGLPSTSRHNGLGFAVASYLAGGLLRYWSVSDTLAVIQLTLGSHSTLTIINAYGPTSQVTLRNQDTQDDFYAALDSITTRYSSSALIVIAGDFNSKLGKKTPKRTLDRRAFMWHQEHEWLSARWLS